MECHDYPKKPSKDEEECSDDEDDNEDDDNDDEAEEEEEDEDTDSSKSQSLDIKNLVRKLVGTAAGENSARRPDLLTNEDNAQEETGWATADADNFEYLENSVRKVIFPYIYNMFIYFCFHCVENYCLKICQF